MTNTQAVTAVLAVFDSAPSVENPENTLIDDLIEMAETLLPIEADGSEAKLAEILGETVNEMFYDGLEELPEEKFCFRLDILTNVDYPLLAGFLFGLAKIKRDHPASFAGLRELLGTGDAARAMRLYRMAEEKRCD